MATQENRTRLIEALEKIREETLNNKLVSETQLQEYRTAFRCIHGNVPYQRLLYTSQQIMTDLLKKYNSLISESHKFDLYFVTSEMLKDLERRLIHDALQEYLTCCPSNVTLYNIHYCLNKAGRTILKGMYAGVGLTVNDFATGVKIIKPQVRNEIAHPCNEQHGIPYTSDEVEKVINGAAQSDLIDGSHLRYSEQFLNLYSNLCTA